MKEPRRLFFFLTIATVLNCLKGANCPFMNFLHLISKEEQQILVHCTVMQSCFLLSPRCWSWHESSRNADVEDLEGKPAIHDEDGALLACNPTPAELDCIGLVVIVAWVCTCVHAPSMESKDGFHSCCLQSDSCQRWSSVDVHYVASPFKVVKLALYSAVFTLMCGSSLIC